MANHEQNSASTSGIEKLPGCPICDRSDAQLERELHAFAQLLFDIWLAKQEENRSANADTAIDKGP